MGDPLPAPLPLSAPPQRPPSAATSPRVDRVACRAHNDSPPSQLQKALGHRDIHTVLVYTQGRLDRRLAGAVQAPSSFGRRPTPARGARLGEESISFGRRAIAMTLARGEHAERCVRLGVAPHDVGQ